MSRPTPCVHASLIARRERGGWTGVLLRGRSGVGKSDLALRAVAAGWRLVADDRVRLWRSGERLFGSAPAELAGLCEARGQGIVVCAALAFAPVAMVADLHETDAGAERQPAARTIELEGVCIPWIGLRAGDASAAARLVHALSLVDRAL